MSGSDVSDYHIVSEVSHILIRTMFKSAVFLLFSFTLAHAADVWVINQYANNNCTGDITSISAGVVVNCQGGTFNITGQIYSASTQNTFNSSGLVTKVFNTTNCSGTVQDVQVSKNVCDGQGAVGHLSTSNTFARAPTKDVSVQYQWFLGGDCNSAPSAITINFTQPCNRAAAKFGQCQRDPTSISPVSYSMDQCGDNIRFPGTSGGNGVEVTVALLAFIVGITLF
ncbi:hypothetical protein PROFUN_05163 [Planoprotostelium fungivorum]|uniref:Uncharacterized protein n=1 Tax=Planoprotostelium fungivorum TaxID=1890364 RepID=A0A2P6NRU3_9EUKA|nr:hypothetical protein PROFUN_05163 [Planoprotostelium fungivorum]